MNIPAELKYTKDHEWIRIEGKKGVIGITDFAQKELGDIVFVEVETVDETLEEGETFGTIEAVKTVSDLFMPISGTITEYNEDLTDNPEVINKDPFGKGWIVKIDITDLGQIADLMNTDAYKAHIEG
ncbi:MAG: glycine cleavage system protein H [Bacteroidetes bacterium HGW-Bacteroidetes-1]|jgi:glycine cleavage system H protein|nr:MAG: glycine cleavage system protein H [Bacteroidetes bacterium HGW-Bacteroidetes-1]